MTEASGTNASTPPPGKKRRVFWRVVVGCVVVLLLLALGAIWYANTPRFQKFLRGKMIAELQQVTGGRVEMGNFQWSLFHLSFAVNNLTIHGLESHGELPYAHIDRVYVRAKIISLFEEKIGLNYFEADHPIIHLIVYPDGSTNQPHPKTHATNTFAIDTIFDLKIDRAEVRNGIAVVNERKTKFNAAANDLGLLVTYLPAKKDKAPERYNAKLHLEDLTLDRHNAPTVHSAVDAVVELERNRLILQSMRVKTGDTQLNLSGSLVNLTNPAWTLQAKGGVALEAVESLTGIPGVNRGRVQIDLQGSGTRSNFEVNGRSTVSGASYHAGSIHVVGLSAQTQLHIDQDELDLTGLQARLPGGGVINGDLQMTHWLHANPTSSAVPNLPPATRSASQRAHAITAKPAVQRGMIHAQLHGLALASIMSIVAPAHYSELGFDTEASGNASVEWTGSPDAFTIAAQVSLAPPIKPTAGGVPMWGAVDAQYSNVSGLVAIHNLDVHTPASDVKVTGSLGVYPVTRGSNLQVVIETEDAEEFNPVLTTLGVAAKGRKGLSAIPVALHGNVDFTGTITDSILKPDVKGHLDATNFDVTISTAKFGTREVHWDSIAANAEYSSRRIAVSDATLERGPTRVMASGELDAHSLSGKRWAFDDESSLQAQMSVKDAGVQDLLKLTGRDIPITGTVNVSAHASGRLNDLKGSGHVAVLGGTAYGESYKSLNADLRFNGAEVDVVNLAFLEDGGWVTGNGGYNRQTQAVHFLAHGQGFDLEHMPRLQSAKYKVSGNLAFEARGNGTLRDPHLQANAHVTRLSVNGVLHGFVDAQASTQGQTLRIGAHANIANTQLQLQAQTQLAGDLPTQAQLTLANFDVAPFLSAMNVQGVAAHSSIGATITVNGPLRHPRAMSGDATAQQFAVSLSGVNLKNDGVLHATLSGGRLHLDPVHIVGPDTDLRAQGWIGALTQSHDLDLQASGSVNMTLAQSLNNNVSSSGRVDFRVNANGVVSHPLLTGNVKFTNVSFALQNFPNGLSNMNGTLQFDQDRLDVKDLTAVSGGGKLTLGGFVTYQQGIYADLNASAKGVRIRYPQGVTTMVDARLRLQGTRQSALLSGLVTINRFSISSALDLTSFHPATGGLSVPPNPKALTSHVRLDVHIVSAPQLDFQNSYAKLAGYVDLRVRGTIAQPSVLGHISITEGSATFAGTKYELQHGDIYFSNPVQINPTLDLSATARVEDYDITVGLSGTAAKPVPTFRSEPPLSEQDIFSLLALGRTQEEQQIYTNMQSQAGVNSTADALLGGALNATLSSRIQKLFGGGSVKIDPTFVTGTGNATARITVQQQISKYATLTYATNVNSTAQQLIQGEINLTQNLSVLAVRDEAGVFSLVFKLRRAYR